MPAQLGEIVTFQAQWSVLGVPTGSLTPTPTITIYAPDGSVLVNAANMTALGSSTWYGYTYTLPNVAGQYKAQPFCSGVGLDLAYLQPIVSAVGQAWIQDLDAAVSSRSTFAGGAVASVTGNVGGNVVGSVGSLAAQAKADVNAEMVDVLTTDTYAEPTEPPGDNASIEERTAWTYMMARRKLNQTNDTQTLYDANGDPIATADVVKSSTDVTRDEWVAAP